MSAPCFGWAIDVGRARKLPTSERFVLTVLSNRANGQMVCWPSMPTIAGDTGLSVRTIHTAVHRLETRGLIRTELKGRVLHYHILRTEEPMQPLPGSDDGPGSEPMQPLHPSSHEPVRPLHESSPGPVQPLQGSSSEPVKPLQASEPGPMQPVSGPMQPLQADPCNSCIGTHATIATKTTKIESTTETETRAGAREAGRQDSDSDLEEGKPAKREPDYDLSREVGRSFRHVAYAQGQRPARTAEEQVAAITPPRGVRPAYLPDDILARQRAETKARVLAAMAGVA